MPLLTRAVIPGRCGTGGLAVPKDRAKPAGVGNMCETRQTAGGAKVNPINSGDALQWPLRPRLLPGRVYLEHSFGDLAKLDSIYLLLSPVEGRSA